MRDWLLVLRASRDWRMFLAALLVVSLASVLLGRLNARLPSAVAVYGPPVLAISLLGGMWEFAQRASVWTLIAQRPGSESARWWSLLRSGLLLYVVAGAVMLAAALTGLALNPELSRRAVTALALESALWLIVVGAAVSLTSTLRTRGSAAFSIFWLATPFIIAMVRHTFATAQGLGDALGFLVPPFDAVWDYSRVLRGELPDRAVVYTAQLVAFPILCFVLVGWRIRVLAEPDRHRTD